ncbi:MAG: hypothetical protein MUP47_09380 [Phycisphaerae bacterium]|nr:hypothetical protein [Phycisphaerae bacterium]
MARVVQRRTAPPYLLVTFVILFLLATAAAVLLWVQMDDLKTRNRQLEDNYRRAATVRELSNPSPAVRVLLSQYDRDPQRTTVLMQQASQIDELGALITGARHGYAAAKATADQLAHAIGISLGRGLVTETREMHQELARQRGELEGLRAQNADLAEKLSQKDQSLAELTASFTAQTDQLRADMTALDEKVKQAHEQFVTEQQRARKELEDRRAELSMEIASKNQRIRQLETDMAAKDETIERLRAELDKKRGAGGADVAARRADGKLLEVKEREDVCYINLGTKDRVVPGLTFTVYPPTGIPESGEGKAKIVVTNAREAVSECRIVERTSSDPVIPGDLVANVAYDPQRTFVFVVDGQFDLRGKGEASSEDVKDVKLLIQQYGGQIADQVDVRTDFVVLGTQPQRPEKPSENAAQTVWAAYEARRREFNRDQETLEAAKNMHVPILNTNRFLALIGYSKKTSPQ